MAPILNPQPPFSKALYSVSMYKESGWFPYFRGSCVLYKEKVFYGVGKCVFKISSSIQKAST